MKKLFIVLLIFSFVNIVFGFSSKKEINKNLFSINQTGQSDFFEYYKNIINEKDNILLSSDFLFYVEHLFVDYSLRYIEKEFLIENYKHFLSLLINEFRKEYSNIEDKKIKQSYNQVLEYLYTAVYLVDNKYIIPKEFNNIVMNEIKLINNHNSIKMSNIFYKEEDFTQYKPRGHYNDDIELKKYFKSMMYLQRMKFNTKYNIELRSIILISKILQKTNIQNSFDKIYNIISIYLPQSDDIKIFDVYSLWNKDINESNLKNKKYLQEFAKKIANKNNAAIISDIVDDTENKPVFVGLIGQRYIFDSDIFQHLVYDKVLAFYGKGKPFTMFNGYRMLPRGLDLFYVLGSKTAHDILEKEQDIQYKKYEENINELKKKFRKLGNDNFYNCILLQYVKMIENKNNIDFMNNEKWKFKELNTMLASWASLRHDVILYAKMSYSVKLTAHKPIPELNSKKIITEPYIELYEQMRKDFINIKKNFKNKTIVSAIDNIIELIDKYIYISELTIQNGYLDEKLEILLPINNVNISLNKLLGNKKEKNCNTAIIADVHTDINSGMVLEEGVGNIYKIDVIHNNKNFIGGILPYYEFKQPMNNRLSDEEWREILKNSDDKKYMSNWQELIYD